MVSRGITFADYSCRIIIEVCSTIPAEPPGPTNFSLPPPCDGATGALVEFRGTISGQAPVGVFFRPLLTYPFIPFLLTYLLAYLSTLALRLGSWA